MESPAWILFGITVAGFIITIITQIVSYGKAQRKHGEEMATIKSNIKSDKEQLNMRIDALAMDCTRSKETHAMEVSHLKEKIEDLDERNNKQHEEFYDTKYEVKGMATTMGHILSGIEEIKQEIKDMKRDK